MELWPDRTRLGVQTKFIFSLNITKMNDSDFYVKRCHCGAITVDYQNDAGEKINISMTEEDFNEHFPDLEPEGDNFCGCNYCTNHWGIDLCACGSGEKVGECEEDFHECRNSIPAQTIDVAKVYALWN